MNQFRIVFVEINRLPKWTLKNIEHLKNLFPHIEITLLTDSLTARNSAKIEKYCQIVCISRELDSRLLHLSRFQSSRDSFWIYTTQRLFALCNFHFKNPSFSLLHVESDVLLMKNFPFEKLNQNNTLLWGNYNLSHDVASLVYLPSPELTELLYKMMLKHLALNINHSDMTLLSAIAKELSSSHRYFPSIPRERTSMINSVGYWPKEFIVKQSKLFDTFGGVFDHQIIGMYLDGVDPRLTFGLRETLFDKTILSGESFVDPRNLHFSMNNILTVSDLESTFPLYSIHLHSKNLELFDVDNGKIGNTFLNLNKKVRVINFDFKVFWGLVCSNIYRRTFHHWSRHLARFLHEHFFGARL